ncbi:helix-turn-helix domain-containing protein [Dysgonomonas sp. BGC7]|uniref:helix-turn-helix domain-containing protein n=1 Tax=Dysgonomonas sp. BGC7 TaxID=1658008 RepID=UPI000682C1EF|nr:helix-turn-helix domain-containing protein [Dysgonomonas sp. BGC7]MBD8387793.1 helix-turn-helix domain-containing protein [Dysgonomonas sp. BGC7]
MKIIAIEEKTYQLMKAKLKEFSLQLRELCGKRENKDEWFDNQEVCQLLKISKRTLQTYRDNGTLAHSQIGYKCYYKKVDIEKLIEASIIKK